MRDNYLDITYKIQPKAINANKYIQNMNIIYWDITCQYIPQSSKSTTQLAAWDHHIKWNVFGKHQSKIISIILNTSFSYWLETVKVKVELLVV